MSGSDHLPTIVVYSPQCPNCARFLDALSRLPVSSQVRLVDVTTLSAAQTAGLTAVPALMTGGRTLYGTKAFEWLKNFEQEAPLDSYDGSGGSLAFSDVSSAMGYASYSTLFSQFEPVPE
jgi:hypothetical protein